MLQTGLFVISLHIIPCTLEKFFLMKLFDSGEVKYTGTAPKAPCALIHWHWEIVLCRGDSTSYQLKINFIIITMDVIS